MTSHINLTVFFENISTNGFDRLLIDSKEVETVEWNNNNKNDTVNKATGPDGISAFVLKNMCRWIKTCLVPHLSEVCGLIVQAMKINENNDFRPFALNPVVVKLYGKNYGEQAVVLDPYQFGYRHHRVTKHLENPKAYCWF